MVQVSDVILNQFVDNFIAKARALDAPDTLTDSSATAPQTGESSKELNGLGIVWALLKTWLGGLFGKNPAN